MKNFIRIGVLAQSSIPSQLEVLVEAILREQFRKLNSIFGQQNLALIGSIQNKVAELACISAIEEQLKLELEPFESSQDVGDDQVASQRVHAVLVKQPKVDALSKKVTEEQLLQICHILVLAYDKSEARTVTAFEATKEKFFGSELKNTSPKKLVIEINVPTYWTPDADGEVYFDYVAQLPGQLALSSEIEVPEEFFEQWNEEISSPQH
jgi:hypothetical protein